MCVAQAKSHIQILSITGTGCDGVIGIGGSQVLDASKLISLIGTNRTSFTSLDEFAEEHAESMRSAQMGSGQSLASLTKDPATLFTVRSATILSLFYISLKNITRSNAHSNTKLARSNTGTHRWCDWM